jgi:hypothetical protein
MEMRKLFAAVVCLLLFAGCATGNNYNKEIPIHTLTVGIGKQEVISKLGNPHRVVRSEVVAGVNRQVWMYQQDKLIWLTGNAFLGGQTRNDQKIYLLGFEDDKLVGWKDNDYGPQAKPENTFEFRNR